MISRISLVVCFLAWFSPAAPGDELDDLNAAFRGAYAAARDRLAARSGPIIVVDPDKLIFLRGQERREVEVVPRLYHDLKAVAHSPLAVHALLADAPDGPLDDGRLGPVYELRQRIAAARGALDGRGFGPAQKSRQEKILDEQAAFLDAVLRQRRCPAVDLATLARQARPLVLANADEAARLQIDGLHRAVAAWRDRLPADEWRQVTVVVMGSQLPRNGHLAVQYFATLLGERGEGRRIVYAEALFDEGRALRLLGSHRIDRRTATAFFDDPERLHRDLLSDAAAAYLREIGPRLGERGPR